ncbi:hypothetical protein [Sandarakinorhabdus sp.]|uniref:hypothetical protein n=1 Tax=Sandarakinorhabdus sp. TaxID=1916663 RepID=UPI0033405DA2
MVPANIFRLLIALGLGTPLLILAIPAAALYAPPAVSGAVVVTPSDAARRADNINGLMAGRLEPSIDARKLFTISLSGDEADVLRWTLTMRKDRTVFRQALRDPAILIGLSRDKARLAIKLAEFLWLTSSRQAELFNAHAAREAAARTAAVNVEKLAGRQLALRLEAAELQAYLDGRPASVASLSVDLLDGGDIARLGNSLPISTDRSVATRFVATKVMAEPVAVANAKASVDELQAWVDRLRVRILALPASDRVRLDAIQSQSGKLQQASGAASARAPLRLTAANMIASEAGLETDRRMAVQAGKFAAYRQSLGAMTMELEESKAAIIATFDAALGWQQRVAALAEGKAMNGGADRQYQELIDTLRSVRSALGMALARTEETATYLPLLPALDPLLPANDPRTVAQARERNLLALEADKLQLRAKALVWQQRKALYDAMIDMNAARLQLIDFLSPESRARVTGFDVDGVAQVKREIQQIALTINYNTLMGLERARDREYFISRSGSTIIMAFIELLLLSFIFSTWRKRGGSFLQAVEKKYLAHRPKTLTTSFLTYGAGIAHKLGRPLDWLVFLLLLAWLYPTIIEIGAIQLVWLVLVWFAAAATMVLFIDALVQGVHDDDPRAALRRRSLRLVIGVMLGVGLSLSLTIAAVGEGAIYNWVLTFCWLLLVPLIILLSQWWRDRIDALAALGAPRNVVLAWSSTHANGVAGSVGRIAAGAILMLQGTQSVAARRINQLALIREVSGQRARDKATARVRADEASGRFVPVRLDEAERLSPHGRPLSVFKADIPVQELDSVAFPPGCLVAIIGERGLGKTTTIERFLAKSAAPKRLLLSASTSGLSGILAALSAELQCDTTLTAICNTLETSEYAIAIDDVQRLVVPSIGGLDGFDQLIALARASGGGTSWLFAIGGPAWSYLARARSDRAMFDDIVYLKRWRARHIRFLVEHRTEQAGLRPVFNLDAQNAGTMLFDSDIAPEERARRQFFGELTDYVAGNPAVALEFWRRALFRDQVEELVAVRTYRTPDTAALFSLPKATQFVLRALLQMEIASVATIATSTDLPSVVIWDSLRALMKLGVISEIDGGYRLTLYWFQDVRRLLESQNLVVGGAVA